MSDKTVTLQSSSKITEQVLLDSQSLNAPQHRQSLGALFTAPASHFSQIRQQNYSLGSTSQPHQVGSSSLPTVPTDVDKNTPLIFSYQKSFDNPQAGQSNAPQYEQTTTKKLFKPKAQMGSWSTARQV